MKMVMGIYVNVKLLVLVYAFCLSVLLYDSDLCSEIAPRMRDYYVFFGGFVVKLRLDQWMISK